MLQFVVGLAVLDVLHPLKNQLQEFVMLLNCVHDSRDLWQYEKPDP